MKNPLTLIDFYKADHRRQYPEGTTLVYSNLTPRKSRVPGVDHIVWFGLGYFINAYLLDLWNAEFFDREKLTVCNEYKRRMDTSLGEGAVTVEHIAALHDLGYLPLEIRALPEGTLVPMGVPCMVIWNTKPEFFWLVNYLETLLSAVLWGPCTSATTANRYRVLLDAWCEKTGGDPAFVPWQGHDFSMRGMMGVEAAALSGAGHLLSFTGTDSVAAIDFLEEHYLANAEDAMVGGSVPATEHSVMCMGTEEGEFETFKRLITKVYPKGVVSIVSDTWDLWVVLASYLPMLKQEILGREGKVVIRPDSGDPVEILCGLTEPVKPEHYLANVGVIEALWNIFGGTVNAKGYKQLDPHIGAIYGDSITVERADEICRRLEAKGFASTNVVFGIGSYTYQYVTRDTYGFAMKATYGEVNGAGRTIYKQPKTDNGTKNSARGLLAVKRVDGKLQLQQDVNWADVQGDDMEVRFRDGKPRGMTTNDLFMVRARLALERNGMM
jgi:nicotinamide phosphoribosyltransferase